MPLRVVVIMEGHGEDGAIRTLLERTWYELLGGDYIEVIPWRGKQGQLRKKESLSRVVEAAAIKLHATERTDFRRLLLVMIDTEGEECPKTIAPMRVELAREVRSDPATEIACVMPNPMFETWFAASADSLRGKNHLPPDLPKPEDPEGNKLGKSWVKKYLPLKYKETVDQPRFAGQMNLTECGDSSRSFRKLIKEMRQRLPPSLAPAPPPPATVDQPQTPEQG
jgi:Domain of unknown function (DUF4276)